MPKSPAQKAAQSPTNAANVRKTRSRTPVLNEPASANVAGGEANTPRQSRSHSKAATPATPHSPRHVKPPSAGTQERSVKRADFTPASEKQATRPAAPTPRRGSGTSVRPSHTAQASKQKALGEPAAAPDLPSTRKKLAARKQPARSPLNKATPTSAATPAAGLIAAAPPSAAVPASTASNTIKTHQRRRRSSALGTDATPVRALVHAHSKAAAGGAAVQTAPAAAGAKRKARTADDYELAALSPGTRKKRRATMPAGEAGAPMFKTAWRMIRELKKCVVGCRCTVLAQ